MREILEDEASLDDAGDWLRPLHVFGSPVQHLREAFDLMTYDTEAVERSGSPHTGLNGALATREPCG